MHMHNAWLLRKSDLTIDLPSDYSTKSKYLFMFCGTLTLLILEMDRTAIEQSLH